MIARRGWFTWDDPDPAAVIDDEILARLLALNLARSAPRSPARSCG